MRLSQRGGVVLPHRQSRGTFSPQLKKWRELTAEGKITSLRGGQHRVCLVCGNAAARLPHIFRAEARTHFQLRAFLRKRFNRLSAAQLQRGTSPPLRIPKLSEGDGRNYSMKGQLIMKKDIKFSTRMAAEDRATIKELATQSRMSMSNYVTACCLGQQIIIIEGLKEVLKELKAIGNNLNQLVTLAHMGKITVANLNEVRQLLADIRTTIREIAERKRW